MAARTRLGTLPGGVGIAVLLGHQPWHDPASVVFADAGPHRVRILSQVTLGGSLPRLVLRVQPWGSRLSDSTILMDSRSLSSVRRECFIPTRRVACFACSPS